MTTRRDVLTGLVALPITAATSGTAEADPAPAEAVTARNEPLFLYDVDAAIYREIETIQAVLARLKREAFDLDSPHPLLRSASATIMRNSFAALQHHVDFAARKVAEQRDHEQAALAAWKKDADEQLAGKVRRKLGSYYAEFVFKGSA